MDSGELIRRRVFDPIQRVLHWWIGATVMALAILGWTTKVVDVGSFRRSLTEVHIVLGFALTIGFLMRLVWGMVGPRQARFKALWQSIEGLARRSSRSENEHFGYEGIASLAYAFLYLTIACAVLSGLLLAGMRYDQGPFAEPLFDELAWHELVLMFHNASLYGATAFVFAHVTGMIRHENSSGLPVAQSMISGYQYRVVQQKGVNCEHKDHGCNSDINDVKR